MQVLRDRWVERSQEFAPVYFPVATPDKSFQRRQVRKTNPYFCANVQPRESLYPEACGRNVGQPDVKGRTARFAEPRRRGHACPLRGPPLRFAIIASGFPINHGSDRHFSVNDWAKH